ncbi:SGNH/GDSL hydrolase family protein [Aliisedimentitalea scapharcae]|uniref:SGNH/GDSL hydrolase family protein n=1 Tax=Aliisedimentitalea scapharcae TaxID=1524259 RepID=A0ABZ2XRU1_9RHOB
MFATDQIIRLGLLPLLIAQGLYVRSQATVLPEPKGPRSGRTGTGPELTLLILGDSSAAGVGTDHQSTALCGHLVARLASTHSVHWRLEATTGHTTQDAVARMQALPDLQFDIAVAALGVNDVTRGTSARRFAHCQDRLIALLRSKFRARLILLSGVPPMQHFPALPQPLAWVLGQQSKRLDQALSHTVQNHGAYVRHLPFDLPPDPDLAATDGYHPNATAYGLWAARLHREITDSAAFPGSRCDHPV